jgi:Amt family ammonium transporter
VVFIGAWTLLVYAPVAHWVFDFSAGDHVGGWLANQVGVIDFAGGTAVEICSGASGLALALVLG